SLRPRDPDLSAIVDLLPGDVIFTGTPSGIGMTRTPPRYLAAGDRLDRRVDGVGTMSHTFVSTPLQVDAVRAPSTKEDG
ncbi:MAG: fumarylacetoacetate hydrolase family protein, partial [Pseudonocardiaceae bacterium]